MFIKPLAAALILGLSGTSLAADVSYRVLHTFHGAERTPAGALVSDASGRLYGTTLYGGADDGGTVFAVEADGTGFQLLHTFSRDPDDGFRPEASLVADVSGNLYGTTANGGRANCGTVFRIREDGGGFTVVHSFAGGPGGSLPVSALVYDGAGTLYGTTVGSNGSVYRLRTDGSGFETLHAFKGGEGDGRGPQGQLLLDGTGNIFGATIGGGHPWVSDHHGVRYDGPGTIYTLKTDGSAFRILRAFTNYDPNDAASPAGGLATDASGALYGLTYGGGAFSAGAAFTIARDGTGFRILRSFAYDAPGERYPTGSPVLDSSGEIYGTTYTGLFKMRSDGSGFTVLRVFSGTLEGATPAGLAIPEGSRALLVTMAAGGAASAGTIFRVGTDGGGVEVLWTFQGFRDDGADPLGGVVSDGLGRVFGTTNSGGASNLGTVYTMNRDGGSFRILHAFTGKSDDGARPWSPVVLDRSGFLYGTTPVGGESGSGGTVFRLASSGVAYGTLHSFFGGDGDGWFPASAPLLDAAGRIYGTTVNGGPHNAGTVYSLNPDGSGFRILHAFAYAPSSDGAEPYAGLVLDGSGNLYGATSYGGSANHGTVFLLRTDGTGFKVLHAFSGGTEDGLEPMTALIWDGGVRMFGTTRGGGQFSSGVLFEISTDGARYRTLHHFAAAAEGASATVTLGPDASLYGTTAFGGPFGEGTAFRIGLDGSAARILHSFGEGASDGRSPSGGLSWNADGTLIGTTQSGGSANTGTIFTVSTGLARAVSSGVLLPVRRR